MIINQFKGEYAFLSNFYSSPFTLCGITYPTVEHFYQSQKMHHKKDKVSILSCKTPTEAKKLGRKFPMRPDWTDARKMYYMRIGLLLKFENNFPLVVKLLNTENVELIEGNHWHDNFWGKCTCNICQNLFYENRLGMLLMETRDFFRGVALHNIRSYE